MNTSKNITIAAIGIAMTAALLPAPAFATLQSDLDEASAAASEAQARYDEAVAEQESLQAKIDELNGSIAEHQTALPEKEDKAARAVKGMYQQNEDFLGWLNAILTGDDLGDVLANFEAYERITASRTQAVAELNQAKRQLEDELASTEGAKADQDAKVAEAEQAKVAALDAQETARAAVNAAAAAQASYSIPTTTQRAATSSSWSDEESAKSYIIGKESGGNYNARNGRYYGAYQLTESYLGGDYSPENQDRVAQSYVEGRYGSWAGAAAFWDSHGWY